MQYSCSRVIEGTFGTSCSGRSGLRICALLHYASDCTCPDGGALTSDLCARGLTRVCVYVFALRVRFRDIWPPYSLPIASP